MSDLQRKNQKILIAGFGIVAAMIALTFASVPLYRIFCQMTGYEGTVQVGGVAPGADKISNRKIAILFDARTDKSLPWQFGPETRRMDVRVGEQSLISYQGTNISAKQTVGTAVYNVTPDKAGRYFHKTQCFCFNRQELGPGKTAHFPVVFYLDPAMLDDPEMDDVTDITLSYTFYATDSKNLDAAIEKYGDKQR